MNENRYSILWHALERINSGSLDLTLPNGNKMRFESPNKEIVADIQIKNWFVFDAILSGGDIALGETYMEGFWQTSDLPSLLSFLAVNSEILEKFFHANKISLFIFSLQNIFRKNSKIGSKRNIKYHYDLGNDFYKLWLDETMTYSSALYDNNDFTLKEAQENKYNRILSKINYGNILEIGCGWGGFAQKAAIRGNNINCLTVSKEQAQFVRKNIKSLELNNNVSINLRDYRDEKGKYDSIVSIEMFEAVGKQYWSKYFQSIFNCLENKGTALIQTITISDNIYKDYKNRFDFIQKHIFPGGFLPSKEAFINSANKENLNIIDQFSFGKDYQKTLLLWLKNFDKKKSTILAMGFSEEFIRKWRFYLAYCAAGFASARTDVVQFSLVKE